MKYPALFLMILCLMTAMSASAAAESQIFLPAPSDAADCRITVDHPDIVSIALLESPDSGFMLSCTGLSEGRTCVTAAFPDGTETLYAVSVDNRLNASVFPAPDIELFDLSRNGELAYEPCRIEKREDGYQVYLGTQDVQWTGEETIHALYRILYTWDVFSWDGFHESAEDVLDGEGFWLEVALSDGTYMHATGSNRFPEHYGPVMHALQEVVDHMELTSETLVHQVWTVLTGFLPERTRFVVGQDIPFYDILEFYYTLDPTIPMGEYQRYHFFTDVGKHMFEHETRKGLSWPQTEEDITCSGVSELSADDWDAFCAFLDGGTVSPRDEFPVDGDAGPWTYLYWRGDTSDSTEFSFASQEKLLRFESFCESLRDLTSPGSP